MTLRKLWGEYAELVSKLPFEDRPVIVGGNAVEFYSGGSLESGDFDIIGDRQKIRSFLLENGFKKESIRHFTRGDIFIDIVGSRPEGKTQAVIINSVRVPIISLEFLIIDRLSGCVHEKDRRECERGLFLLKKYWPKLDKEYLMEEARLNEVSHVIDSFKEEQGF